MWWPASDLQYFEWEIEGQKKCSIVSRLYSLLSFTVYWIKVCYQTNPNYIFLFHIKKFHMQFASSEYTHTHTSTKDGVHWNVNLPYLTILHPAKKLHVYIQLDWLCMQTRKLIIHGSLLRQAFRSGDQFLICAFKRIFQLHAIQVYKYTYVRPVKHYGTWAISETIIHAWFCNRRKCHTRLVLQWQEMPWPKQINTASVKMTLQLKVVKTI